MSTLKASVVGGRGVVLVVVVVVVEVVVVVLGIGASEKSVRSVLLLFE